MPFSGKEPNEIVTKIRSGFYKPLQELVSVPDRLATLVARLLAPNPDDRPQRGQDVAAELTDIARQYGLDRSGTNIAQVLTHLFPNDGHAMFELPVTLVRELPTDGAAPGGPASGASGESADLGHDETLLSAGAPPHPGPHRGHQPPQRRPAPSATVPLSMQSPAPPGPTLPPGQGRGHQAPLRVMPLPPVARRQTRPPFSAVSALVIAGVALVIIVAMYLLVRPT